MAEFFDAGEAEAELSAAAQTDSAAVSLALARRARRKRGPGATRDDQVDTFLAKQEMLIDKQARHLDAQMAHMRLKHFDERLSVALKLGVAALALLIVLGVGAMAWTASKDSRVVVDPIRAPADLAQQGSDPAALANALQDKVSDLQAQVPMLFASSQLQQKKPPELKVVIPETGVSIGELDEGLRGWLGHATHVSGEVSRPLSGPDRGALVLNLRVGAAAGVRLVQPDGDLDALLAKGAERVFAKLDPFSHAYWLGVRQGRKEEGVAELKALTQSGSPDQRAQAYQMLTQAAGIAMPLSERRRLLGQAMALTGRAGANDFYVVENSLGHTEAAARNWILTVRRGDAAANTFLSPQGRRFNQLVSEGNAAGVMGDYANSLGLECYQFSIQPCDAPRLAQTILDNAKSPPDAERTGGEAPRVYTVVRLLARMHQPGLALRLATVWPHTLGLAPTSPPNVIAQLQANWTAPLSDAHFEAGDWAAVIADAQAWEALAEAWPGLDYPASPRQYRPIAMAHLGDLAGAERAAAALPGDCYRCLITRAEVAELAHDPASADRWFAAAAAQGPSLPFAETAWGRVLVARGKPDLAIGKLTVAHRKAPRFADATAYWGEALLAKGDARGAAEKFAEAAKLTPRWGRLRLKWGEALARLGKPADARAQLKAAASMDLSPQERAELAAQRV